MELEIVDLIRTSRNDDQLNDALQRWRSGGGTSHRSRINRWFISFLSFPRWLQNALEVGISNYYCQWWRLSSSAFNETRSPRPSDSLITAGLRGCGAAAASSSPTAMRCDESNRMVIRIWIIQIILLPKLTDVVPGKKFPQFGESTPPPPPRALWMSLVDGWRHF